MLAFSLVCKLPPASHSLFKMTLLCTESTTFSCYCKAVQKPFTALLLNQISSVHTVYSVDRLPMRAIATGSWFCCPSLSMHVYSLCTGLACAGCLYMHCVQLPGLLLSRRFPSCAGSKQAAQCPPAPACQPGLEAFLTQAKQQMPSLAGRLTAPQLQDFLCSLHGLRQSAKPSSSSNASSVQVAFCM